ncbi:hypothetical protein [Methylobacterium sp. Leaf100]|uniref:hypothetical protein n=1 Tax=Methylobacterium sp. Leaf100 TaxID=1736252 RepID=UPI001FCDC9B9|nr:hypothetical protein [Methylobacterium sp. Leaf100]
MPVRLTPVPAHRRPLAGAQALRRARDAAFERAAIGVCLVLAAASSGFAVYTITSGTHDYAVQRFLPASIGTFAWKKPVAPVRTAVLDLDPTTTGALPDRPAGPELGRSDPADRAGPGVAARGYVLRRVSGDGAWVEGPNGLRQIVPGAVLPGAGRVISIQPTGAGWVVVTSETIIGPTRL